ncbi:MAG TPA: copper resistance CopC family protein [Miltoncostaeaceae bacterium]|nr:copper resistance CopC family protein [Miltoncostaeaceae bacterium]
MPFARPVLPLLAVAALAVVDPAAAHTGLTSSSPRAGARVAALPAVVVLQFSAPIRPVRVQITDRLGGGHVRRMRRDPRDARRVRVRTRPGPAGRYTVRWRVLGPDGHLLTGTFRFTARRP